MSARSTVVAAATVTVIIPLHDPAPMTEPLGTRGEPGHVTRLASFPDLDLCAVWVPGDLAFTER